MQDVFANFLINGIYIRGCTFNKWHIQSLEIHLFVQKHFLRLATKKTTNPTLPSVSRNTRHWDRDVILADWFCMRELGRIWYSLINVITTSISISHAVFTRWRTQNVNPATGNVMKYIKESHRVTNAGTNDKRTRNFFTDQIFNYLSSCSCFLLNKSEINWVVLLSQQIYVVLRYGKIPTYSWISSNRVIFRVTGPFSGEYNGHRWILLTRASNAEFWCFLSFLNKRLRKQSIRWWFETPSSSLRRHCNVSNYSRIHWHWNDHTIVPVWSRITLTS